MSSDEKKSSNQNKPKGQTKNPSPKRITPSIKLDVIHPSDYLKYEILASCDDCSHFDEKKEVCTLGYVTEPHRLAEQKKSYLLNGKVAFCRFHEID